MAFDLDGTITKTVWFPGQSDPEPKLDRIAKINRLYDDCYTIFIYTARREEHREITEAWLARWNVKYNALVCGKLAVTGIYVDDMAINADTYFNDGETRGNPDEVRCTCVCHKDH